MHQNQNLTKQFLRFKNDRFILGFDEDTILIIIFFNSINQNLNKSITKGKEGVEHTW